MRAPLSWLRDFAPIEGEAAEVADALSSLGLVVEGVDHVGEGLGDVVVARVLATREHPDADKVQLVDVDAGGGTTLQIVCGAFNFGAGDLVPLAPVGAKLPGDFEIGRRKLRGQWSEGMLCSATELALSDDNDGIMILAPGSAEPGAPLVEALGLQADVVFDLDVTPNRPDALCMAGIARDLAARLGVPFRRPPVHMSIPALGGGRRGPSSGVVVDSPDLCPRFTSTVLEVSVGPSPAWMANRLTAAGMRPINNVVDLSNYVMLELGQPNHPYDLDVLGGGGLSVRRAAEGESITTLDGAVHRLGTDDCLICDAQGAPVGIGGIMGGESSGIAESTTRVVLEAAWFDPVAIARTSKRTGLRTEASVRFERGVDPEGVDRAVARFCELAAQVAGATVAGPTVDVASAEHLPRRARVLVRTERVNAILGTSLEPDEVRAYLEPIGFECSPTAVSDRRTEDLQPPAAVEERTRSFTVQIPSWRPDSHREIDVIEEVARHHGYANIARRLPPVRQVGGLNRYQRDRRLVREILVGAGVSEAWAAWFLAPGDLDRAGLPPSAVEIENPLVAEERLLPTSLLPGLMRALGVNAAHREPHVSLFEIGHVFLPPSDDADPPVPVEQERLAVALGGKDAAEAVRLWRTLANGLRLDELKLEASDEPGLHPTRTARIEVGGTAVGVVGEIDPTVLVAHDLDAPVGWIDVDLGLLLAGTRQAAGYRRVSRFPSADLDLAFVVPESVPAADVESTLRRTVGELLDSVELFDVYRGTGVTDGNRSLAYHLRFSSLNHTLTDDELTTLRASCMEAVESTHAARLRS